MHGQKNRKLKQLLKSSTWYQLMKIKHFRKQPLVMMFLLSTINEIFSFVKCMWVTTTLSRPSVLPQLYADDDVTKKLVIETLGTTRLTYAYALFANSTMPSLVRSPLWVKILSPWMLFHEQHTFIISNTNNKHNQSAFYYCLRLGHCEWLCVHYKW